jgi:uroporphyrinogen decarboxylase
VETGKGGFSKMIMRQRVIDALNHKQTDLTPWNFELTRGFAAQLKAANRCSDESEYLKCHMQFGRFKRNRWIAADIYEDMFGVQWKAGQDGGDIGSVCNRVIGENGIDGFRFPEVDGELISAAAGEMEADASRFRMFRFTYALFERAWSLMGMEDLMANMLVDPASVGKLFDRLTEYNLKVLEAILPYDFEGVYLGDDWGSQQGLIMGPELWRKFIKPNLVLMFDKIKSHGKYILLHCCGNIGEVLPDLIDIGLDAYNTVQPELYDLVKIKREYGRHLTFWGAISTQKFLPFATPEQVKAQCSDVIRNLGCGGGYIFSPTHAVTPDIPVENIDAMVDCVQSITWQAY